MQVLPAMYGSWVAVTPSDTTRISCRAIFIGGQTGVQTLALSPDATTAATTFTSPTLGAIYPFELNQGRIMSTGTTVTLLVALV